MPSYFNIFLLRPEVDLTNKIGTNTNYIRYDAKMNFMLLDLLLHKNIVYYLDIFSLCCLTVNLLFSLLGCF